jgi:hypothetical protein
VRGCVGRWVGVVYQAQVAAAALAAVLTEGQQASEAIGGMLLLPQSDEAAVVACSMC